VTESLVKHWWGALNHALFDGKLEQPLEIVVKRLKGQWGDCNVHKSYDKTCKRAPIIIRIAEDIDERNLFLSVLAHEMVHQWEQEQFGRQGHGKRFWSWEDRIKSLGLEFDESY